MEMEDKPHHVVRLAKGGHVCMHCGGDVDEKGYAQGGEVEPPAAEQSDDQRKEKSRALLDAALALRGRRHP